MNIEEAINRLNALAVPTPEESRTLTPDELRELLKNPPKKKRSIPSEEAMAVIVHEFANADEPARRSIASKLSHHARRKFLGYAATLAILAVRQNSPGLIEQGLIALVIENGDRDWRDSLIALFQLYHSAVKLGMDAGKTFANIALLAEPGVIKKEMHGFPLRPSESRSLKAFCMEEVETEEGFQYRQIAWKPQNPKPPSTETPQQISARLTPAQQKALIGSAGTLAAMAFKTRSPKFVKQGLQGVALGGGALDPSESQDALTKLHDAAVALGMDVAQAFAEAAEFAPEGELKRVMSQMK